MKKVILVGVLSASVFLCMGVNTNAASNQFSAEIKPVNFNFDDQARALGSDYTSIYYNGHYYVPARFVAENFGDSVIWDGSTQTVSFTNNTSIPPTATTQSASKIKTTGITVSIEDVKFIFDGIQEKLPAGYAALEYNNHVYVPARFVAENLKNGVKWDDTTSTISLYSEKYITDKVIKALSLDPTFQQILANVSSSDNFGVNALPDAYGDSEPYDGNWHLQITVNGKLVANALVRDSDLKVLSVEKIQ